MYPYLDSNHSQNIIDCYLSLGLHPTLKIHKIYSLHFLLILLRKINNKADECITGNLLPSEIPYSCYDSLGFFFGITVLVAGVNAPKTPDANSILS